MSAPLRIWRLSDGRRGHDNQSLGLLDALARLVPVNAQEVAVHGIGTLRALSREISGAAPALVVGAGHRTHLPLIVAARRHRARSVVLMNPSLPRRLFDLCLVPAHDGVSEGANVLVSLGALNRIRPSERHDPTSALLLLGGPSKHYRWAEQGIVEQVRDVVARDHAHRWVIAGSPRTPASTLQALEGAVRARVVPFAETSAGWLPERLARASVVWVTRDSVSMAYEAASSGAAVGLLDLPARRRSRVYAAAEALLAAGYATSMSAWSRGTPLAAPSEPLQEADRCARALLDRWPDLA